MRNVSFRRHWPIALALFLAFCSGGPQPSLTDPSGSSSVASPDSGRVGASAAGDVKVGAGALEIERLRLDRQNSSGASVVRFYAEPNQTYAISAGETIELWAEYPGAVSNPRFRVDWGDGVVDITGCGSCKLTHRYGTVGNYIVRASLDDRVSTTVTRTFNLDSRPLESEVAVNPQCQQPYLTFSLGDRNVTFNDGNGGIEYCDNSGGSPDFSGANWYRFTGAAGTMMPESAPPYFACGTDAPGWLNGAHPGINDGVVNRQSCFNWAGDTCQWNTSIQVVNCNTFYLYRLVDTNVCSLRYCGTN